MNVDPKDDLDRAIDEALASIAGGEPKRVSAASVRQAMGEDRGFTLPLWFPVAAVLIVSLGVVFRRDRAQVAPKPISVARSSEAPAPVEASMKVAPAANADDPPARKALPARTRTTTEAVYEGLPRLTIASLDPPEPLAGGPLESALIQISPIEIAPLSISGLSNEPEHK
jgi:hypothetical protein